MKAKIFSLLAFLMLVCSTCNLYPVSIGQHSAVTFALNGGRLGDNLSNFWRALYFAHKNNLRFLCPEFKYKKSLMLSKQLEPYTPTKERTFRKTMRLKSDNNLTIQPHSILYKIDFYFKSHQGDGRDDEKFMALIKKLIYPINQLPEISLMEDRLNVAIHLRYGSGFDAPFKQAQKIHPLKFPPMSYYFDAIKKIQELTNHQPLHLVFFTDARNPKLLVNLFKQKLSQEDITFSYRENNMHAHQNSVIQDLFSMAQYEYFIRPGSGLSKIAHYISADTKKIVIYPQDARWHGDELVIEKLGIDLRP